MQYSCFNFRVSGSCEPNVDKLNTPDVETAQAARSIDDSVLVKANLCSHICEIE